MSKDSSRHSPPTNRLTPCVRQLKGGDFWSPDLVEAIGSTRVMVLLVSKHTRRQGFFHDEVTRALMLERRNPGSRTLVPVVLDPEIEPECFPYGTIERQFIDYRAFGNVGTVERLHALLQTLGSSSATEPTAQARVWTPPRPRFGLPLVSRWRLPGYRKQLEHRTD